MPLIRYADPTARTHRKKVNPDKHKRPMIRWNQPVFQRGTRLDPGQVRDQRGVNGPYHGVRWANTKLARPIPKHQRVTPWDVLSTGFKRGIEQTLDIILPDQEPLPPVFRVTTWRRGK